MEKIAIGIFVLVLAWLVYPVFGEENNTAQEIADHFEHIGDRINQHLYQKGDQINARFNQKAEQLRENGNYQHAYGFYGAGSRINARPDRERDGIDGRLGRKGNRIEGRRDRNAGRIEGNRVRRSAHALNRAYRTPRRAH